MKKCTKCDQDQPLTEFHIQRQGKNGPIYKSRCKTCTRTADLDRYHNLDPEERKDRGRKNRDKMGKDYHKNYRLLTKYGITLEHFNLMYDDQGGCCEICSKKVDRDKMHVDHCHRSGNVRKLLCHQCNVILGLCYEDDTILLKCIEYLNDTISKTALS